MNEKKGHSNHGIAVLKRNIIIEDEVVHKKCKIGIITAFLPEDNVYAVMFSGGLNGKNWFTFDKESFENIFDWRLFNE